MKLWHVTRTDDGADYDEYSGFVVRAVTEDRAREMVLAGESSRWERRAFAGFNSSNIKVVELTPDGNEAVILDSFHAG